MRLALNLLIICGFISTAHAAPLRVTMKNTKGEAVGYATLTPMIKGVKIDLDVHGLTAGEHALHFHENGSCVGPKFESAGGHFASGKTKHGFDMEGGPHAGDMANFFAAADGGARVEMVNTAVSLNAESLLKAGGTSLVIHDKADDYKTQPSGDAGGRFACGEIKGG